MRKTPVLFVIVALLAAVVGYLALDRSEKSELQEKQKAFDASFAK
ncbi:hypothetical protein [Duganella sp. P38]